MSGKIEGVPEGWELVRIDRPKQDEFYLDGCGEPRACRWDGETAMGCAIVRKIEPPKPIDPGHCWRLLLPHEHKQAPDMVYRRRIEPPKPMYVPWTFETCPVGLVVKNKAATERGMITRVQEDALCIGGCWLNYQYFLEQFEQLDGTPCGTVEVQE